MFEGDLVLKKEQKKIMSKKKGEEVGIDEVEFITADNIKDFSINDVVFPLIGKSIKLPQNEFEHLIFSIMKEDQITTEMFQSNSLDSQCAHGAYRELVCTPQDIKYDLIEFNDKDQDIQNPHYLIPDQEELKVEVDESKPIYKAIRIKFNLPSSSYATMFVRELLHSTSDFDEQIQNTKDA